MHSARFDTPPVANSRAACCVAARTRCSLRVSTGHPSYRSRPHILQYAAGFSPRAPCIPPVLTHRPWQIPGRLAALLLGLAARCGCPPDTRLTARDLTYCSMLRDHCTRAAGGNATGAEVLSPGGGFRVRDRRGTGGRRSGGSRPGLSQACCVKSPNPSSGSLP